MHRLTPVKTALCFNAEMASRDTNPIRQRVLFILVLLLNRISTVERAEPLINAQMSGPGRPFGRRRHWPKVKNPAAPPAVRREAEEDWGANALGGDKNLGLRHVEYHATTAT
jgi:hypothetical protein